MNDPFDVVVVCFGEELRAGDTVIGRFGGYYIEQIKICHDEPRTCRAFYFSNGEVEHIESKEPVRKRL